MWKINTLQLMAERCEEDSLLITWLPDGILFEMSKHKVSKVVKWCAQLGVDLSVQLYFN